MTRWRGAFWGRNALVVKVACLLAADVPSLPRTFLPCYLLTFPTLPPPPPRRTAHVCVCRQLEHQG
jgi:hypothetical protein